MKAIAQTKRCSECCDDRDAVDGANHAETCACATRTSRTSRIIESPPGQSWAEFCEQLEQPAFLYPVTGFSDLE